MDKPFDPAPDLAICQAMSAELDAYLRSDVLYWQMDAAHPGGDKLPKLTIGGFLERARRLQAAPLAPWQQSELSAALRHFEQARDALPARYLARVAHDLRGRLDAWQWFLDDYAKQAEEHTSYYPTQAHTRLAIELLMDEMANRPELPPFVHRRLALDERLRADWIDGPFVWHTSLAQGFPRERFWWLYGKLK